MSDSAEQESTPTSGIQTKINPPVFYGSLIIIMGLVLFSVIAPETAGNFFNNLKLAVLEEASWFYVLTVAIIISLVAFLGISRYGEIKLGPDHSEPDYSYSSWFAMLFSAGMGIGLMFFGVAEPIMHFTSPPMAEPNSIAAAKEAMRVTFFHWGLHAWSIYAIVGLILAYFSFRRGLPLTLRSALYPIIGKKIYGPIGHAVDIFAVVGTVLGVATSLGFGVQQVNAGLNYLFDLPVSDTVQVFLIIGITGLATISVVTGLDAGIRRLSELNLGLAFLLLAFVLILGPTVFLMKTYMQNVGAYLSELVSMTFNLYAYQPKEDGGPQAWVGGWTIFYWGWWIAWSPFVGLFIARISRGRTIREFAMGVMFVPAGFTLFWMTVFGDSAINMIMSNTFAELGGLVNENMSVALFHFLEQFPFSGFISGVATLMVIVFFVTSSDSGSMVVDMLASGGHDDTPVWQRVFWASSEGIVAIALMLAGGLGALQSATIAAALPFSLVLLIAAYGLLRSLKVENIRLRSLQASVAPPPELNVGHQRPAGGWKSRLKNMVNFPIRARVLEFLETTVKPALETVAAELETYGLKVDIRHEDDRAYLEVSHSGEIDFIYGVRVRGYTRPSLTIRQLDHSRKHADKDTYYRAEVFLEEGGQDYDLMGYTKDQVIADVLDQYEKHMHFLHMLR
ncbi:MAG: choline BCCT transporter BetT [Pseudomonadales bacterium]|uniref:BCCT family transporter n=1 Tax=Alcanivorax sp. MD8A TaxID=1177157 RepID=UPI000C9C0F4A|nr:choline BCCT transporter BetT [Alcanivorax sp. MD8A]MCG8436724.1 choline BCCT transporter BetT [Pseudomonadales bacterium]MED5430735.1 choline BCCT transporter BetT [Pseudomonadota bacterium]MEE2869035.1 choline BCCT transporter BetT [Pseudomonadota bacterium]PNE02926.1 Choline/carnitine/betaine transporter family protein [Alcanivorax sp. MD8A]